MKVTMNIEIQNHAKTADWQRLDDLLDEALLDIANSGRFFDMDWPHSILPRVGESIWITFFLSLHPNFEIIREEVGSQFNVKGICWDYDVENKILYPSITLVTDM